ncbi:hypothetical protein, partial [Salmonella enterica]|uniref:hypothetical protein n=1 Tax=Salmonella enterica TaxID=28901 RepID=UPI0019D34D78
DSSLPLTLKNRQQKLSAQRSMTTICTNVHRLANVYLSLSYFFLALTLYLTVSFLSFHVFNAFF